jgi:hypothetical protein
MNKREPSEADWINSEEGLTIEDRYNKMHDLAERLISQAKEMQLEIDNFKSDLKQYDLDIVRALKERNEARERNYQLMGRIDSMFKSFNGKN